MTVYVTYASSLQAGDLAPGSAVRPARCNAGQSLPPYRSKEYRGRLQSVAGQESTSPRRCFASSGPLPTSISADNMFEISGEQVNKGLELSAVGEVAHGLKALRRRDAAQRAARGHTLLPSTNDKIYVGAPKVKGNTLFEYSIPTVPGLVATFDWQFSGPRAADDTNSFFVAGYNLFDLGARYTSTS